jgi:hypothetical protein
MERRDFLEAALSGASIAGLAIATASSAASQAQAGPVRVARGSIPNARFLTFDSISAQFNAVKIGRAAAAQLDVPVARYYAP